MASHRGHSNAPVGVGYEERERERENSLPPNITSAPTMFFLELPQNSPLFPIISFLTVFGLVLCIVVVYQSCS